MNPKSEESQTSTNDVINAMTGDGASSKLVGRQPYQRQTLDCDMHELAMVKVVNSKDDPVDKASKTLKALLEQQEYEALKNTSWADLMDEEITKSKTDLKAKRGKEDPTMKIQSVENDCIVLSSDEENPSLSDAVKQSDMEGCKTSTWKKKRGTRSRFERNAELSADQALKTDVPGKMLRRAVKRDKVQRARALSAMSTDDEEVLASSKYQKKRREDAYAEKIVYDASNSKFPGETRNSKFFCEDFPLSGAKPFSGESSPGSSSSIASTLHIKKGWSEPKLGWCRNETTLLRRSKEIEKAKEKPVYAKYLAKVPRHARTKDMPKTPNKYIQYSRRSWDKQVRLWKRQLYEWAGEDPTQSCLSLNESTSDEISESEATSSFSSVLMSDENRLDEIKVEEDAAASLLGHLDIDTRTNTLTVMKTDDESTLKGTSRNILGPRDFSQL